MQTLLSIHIMRNYAVFLDLWLEVGQIVKRRETDYKTLVRLSQGLSAVARGKAPENPFDYDAALPVTPSTELFAPIQMLASHLTQLGHKDLTGFIAEFEAPVQTWAVELEVHATFVDAFHGYWKGLRDGNTALIADSLKTMVFMSQAGIMPDLDAPMEELLQSRVITALMVKEESEIFNASLFELWMLMPSESDPQSDSSKLSRLGRDNGYFNGFTLPAVSEPSPVQ